MRWMVGAWRRSDRRYFEGARLMRAGLPGEAVRAYDDVLRIFPGHARAHIQRAKALAAAGRFGEAVGAARRAAELAPDNHAPMLTLGQIHYDAGHFEEARKALAAAARIDPENRMIQAWLGLTLLAMGRFEQGAALLREHLRYGYEELEARVVALAERYLWDHRDRARPLEDQLTPEEGGREEKPAGFALRLLSAVRMLALGPLTRLWGKAAWWRLKAEEAFSIREWQEAIVCLKEAEKAGADPREAAAALGSAYLEAGKPEAAAEQFLRLPEEHRRAPDVALALGAALFDSGRYEEAAEYLSLAAERYTRDFAPAYFRGLCEIALRRPDAAVRWFAMAVERLNPHLAEKRLEEVMRVWAAEPPR